MPPTNEQIDAFLYDTSPDAYDQLVSQFLNSVSYAERMTMEWLDVARYADSHGLHADGWRGMWPWRDWVINAFHENKPYNEFVTEQLAGDLLPNPTKDQIIATAFHRNHPMTAEGGVIDEEFRLEYVFDRVNTTAKAIMGITMECARCHDHKFDPISQKEYFQMAAFFNNVKELGMTGDDGNYGPMLMLPSEATKAQIAAVEQSIAEKESALQLAQQAIIQQKAYITRLPSVKKADLFLRAEQLKTDNKRNGYLVDGNRLAFATKEMQLGEGKSGKGLLFDNEYGVLHIGDLGVMDLYDPYAGGAWINTTKRKPGLTQTMMGTAGTKNSFWRGWDFFLDTLNRPSLRFIHSLPHNYIHIQAIDSIKTNEWTHLYFTYDGSGKAGGMQLYVNGLPVESTIEYDNLYKTIKPIRDGNHQLINKPILVGKSYRAFTGENGIFEGRMDDIEIRKQRMSPLQVAQMVATEASNSLFAKEPEQATTNEQKWFAIHTLLQQPKYNQQLNQIKKLREDLLAIKDTVPEIMVMEEMDQPRPMFVYNRGLYDQPSERVSYGTPKEVLDFPTDLPKNRLGLAQWLFHPENPLTARVTVNRYWQLFFGQGLVDTPQDFGNQGALPSHPELLDWLAVTFVESGWDIKELVRLIVTSHTYRQRSNLTPELKELDPYNKLLARGASYRYQAEIIRDNALFTSGLLVDKVGGPSVKPYQPDGLWIELGNFSHKLLTYKADKGDKLYRRSMYTFIRRTSPPPYMTTFDAPNRDVCIVQRENTNTPLQALILMNDPQFVEAARVMAQRILQESKGDVDDQIRYAFRLAIGRDCANEELQLFKELYESELKRFQQTPKDALALLEVGEYPLNNDLPKTQTAALAMVTNTMLNHDEAYMKR